MSGNLGKFAGLLLVWLGVILIIYLGNHVSPRLDLVGLLLLVLMLCAIPVLLVVIARRTIHGNWQSTGLAATALFLCVVAVTCGPALFWLIDVARLGLWQSSHHQSMWQSFDLPAGNVRWGGWGDAGFGGYTYSATLVFDETGDILRPAPARSAEWKSTIVPRLTSLNENCGPSVSRLYGAYFVLRSTC